MNTGQKLVNGNAHFNVAGHSANASVRGTKFEVVTNPDGSMRLKVYVGLVNLAPPGQGRGTVAAGQQADPSPDGTDPNRGGSTTDPAVACTGPAPLAPSASALSVSVSVSVSARRTQRPVATNRAAIGGPLQLSFHGQRKPQSESRTRASAAES